MEVHLPQMLVLTVHKQLYAFEHYQQCFMSRICCYPKCVKLNIMPLWFNYLNCDDIKWFSKSCTQWEEFGPLGESINSWQQLFFVWPLDLIMFLLSAVLFGNKRTWLMVMQTFVLVAWPCCVSQCFQELCHDAFAILCSILSWYIDIFYLISILKLHKIIQMFQL